MYLSDDVEGSVKIGIVKVFVKQISATLGAHLNSCIHRDGLTFDRICLFTLNFHDICLHSADITVAFRHIISLLDWCDICMGVSNGLLMAVVP